MSSLYLCDFRIHRPAHEVSQEQSVNWLLQLHRKVDSEVDLTRFENGANATKQAIHNRGFATPDFTLTEWSQMEFMNVQNHPSGAGTEKRTLLYEKYAMEAFDALYSESIPPAGKVRQPRDLIHVTCTGYVSPSPAQRLVAKKGWAQTTQVTHAYHMGCYAAFSAIRIAAGHLRSEISPLNPRSVKSSSSESAVDIVHTELCTLQLESADHSGAQGVIQGLFADGYIKYSLRNERSFEGGFEILGMREEQVPETEDQMRWLTTDHGMKMTLSREVPVSISRNLAGFLNRLGEATGLSVESLIENAIFAVHPGGPKIIEYVAQLLNLRASQISFSQEVLRKYGNMSSATVPHILKAILESPDVKPGTHVVSLAFGPGLTMCGAILQK